MRGKTSFVFVLLRFGPDSRSVCGLAPYDGSVTMAITMVIAKQSGYVPRKVAGEIKKRDMQQRKAGREKIAQEKETKDMTARWQGAGVPPDIRRP